MQEVIDAAVNLGPHAVALRAAGVRTAIRYYNHRNSTALPTKALAADELAQLFAAGLSVAVVFQQTGGRDGRIGDLDAAHGRADAQRALARAQALGQSAGSAIYFAVDWDYYRASDLAQIARYFDAAKTVLAGVYDLGVYGSGTVGAGLKRASLVDHVWLAGAKGWSGTRQMLEEGGWSLFQRDLEQVSPIGRIDYDGNIVNPTFANFGQFSAGSALDTPRGQGVATLYAVTARSGLIVRGGPGEDFSRVTGLPLGALVTAKERAGSWIAVDIEGDGEVDGYMFEGYLKAVSGGLPAQTPAVVTASPDVRRPIDVARAELVLGVAEVPGERNNPRIVMYHATTTGGAASDETAWCSSFVNYCVEQAGFRGSDSKWARSWHDARWGRDVTGAAEEGDVVVFSRVGNGDNGGHVGFYLDEDATSVRVLGGNQGNRISIASYPKQGTRGPYRYDLLSIRRG